MNKLTAILVASAILVTIAHAQDTSTNTAAKVLSPEDAAAYGKMVRTELELSAQLKLLTDVADDLLKRANDIKQTQSDRAKWQTDFAQELRDRASTRLKELNQLTSDRLAWETAHGPVKNPALGVGNLEQAKALNPEEFNFVSKVDERLVAVRQQLAATLEYGKTFALQLSTNSAPEAVAHISSMVDDNNALLRALERDQWELELKKLEFRALRR